VILWLTCVSDAGRFKSSLCGSLAVCRLIQPLRTPAHVKESTPASRQESASSGIAMIKNIVQKQLFICLVSDCGMWDGMVKRLLCAMHHDFL
jgi:hypothetical protein